MAVNKLKGQVPKWDEKSTFDAEKDKNTFRQYEAACDRVKNFYREQHGEWSAPSAQSQHSNGNESRLIPCPSSEKQTFEFNVRVRAEFKKTVHARMGAYLCLGPSPIACLCGASLILSPAF